MTRKERLKEILKILPELYPDSRCLLDYDGIQYRLLISTILSAQTTDISVNKATPKLWKKYPDLKSLATAESADVEKIIHPLGFFRNKTRSIIKAAIYILDNFSGKLPDNMNDMLKIPGVGRKTANVVLGEIFGKPAIIVDTHVKRLVGRIDLTRQKTPEKIESDLIKLIPEDRRTSFSHQIGFHGRRICYARKPACSHCGISQFCPKRGV